MKNLYRKIGLGIAGLGLIAATYFLTRSEEKITQYNPLTNPEEISKIMIRNGKVSINGKLSNLTDATNYILTHKVKYYIAKETPEGVKIEEVEPPVQISELTKIVNSSTLILPKEKGIDSKLKEDN